MVGKGLRVREQLKMEKRRLREGREKGEVEDGEKVKGWKD